MSRPFRQLWVSTAFSNLGDGIIWSAAPLLAASLTTDPVRVAGVSVAAGLPWFLFSLPAGAIIDRLDRRRIMVATNAVRAALMTLVAVLVWRGRIDLVSLYGLFFLLGTARVLFDNSTEAILPLMVPRDRLERANARLFLTSYVGSQFAGPPVGSFLFGAAMAAPFFADGGAVCLALVPILLMGGVYRVPRPAEAPSTSMTAEIAEGLRWLVRHRLLRTLGIMVGVVNTLIDACLSIFVLFALQVMEVPGSVYGVLLAAGALGGIAATFVAERIVARLGPGTTLIAGMLVAAVSVAVIALVPQVVVVGAMFASVTFFIAVWNVVTVSLRQFLIPPHLLGRVASLYRLLALGAVPLGAAIGGVLGRFLGLKSPFWFTAGVLVVMALVAAPIVNNRTIARARAAAEKH